jgi:hypothetical protein
MTKRGSPAATARLAGLLYIFVVAASSYALFRMSSLIVSGDAAATAANILGAEREFRAAFVANLSAAAAYVAVVALLFALFLRARPTHATVAAFFGLAGCAVSATGIVNQFAALLYLQDPVIAATFDPAEAQALARSHLRSGGVINSISLVFFGFYCILLGALVVRTTFLPKAFGFLLLIGGGAWLANSFGDFLDLESAKRASPYLMGVGAFGEIAFTLWIAIMGVNEKRWREETQVL